MVGPPYSSAAWTVSLHASPQSQYTSGHNTPEEKRYEIQDNVSGDSGILSKATIRHVVDSGMCTLLCVSAEILHKAMVTILSRFLFLTIEFPALSRRQKKRCDTTETIAWEERGHKSPLKERGAKMLF